MNTSATGRRRSGPWIGIAVGLTTVLSAPLLAQPLPTPTGAPTTVDVTVVDARGEPVVALTADRFRVQVGGRTRPVTAASLVRADPAAGRSIVVVLDQSSVAAGAEAPVIDVARGFVRRLVPADRVGLVLLPGPGPQVALTTDHASVLEAMGRMKGRRTIDPAAGRIGLGEALAMADGDPLAIGAVSDRDCVGIGDTLKAQNGMETGILEMPVGECFKRIMRNADRLAAEATKAGASVIPGVVSALGTLDAAPGARAVVIVTSGLATGRREPALPELTARTVASHATVHALLVDPAVQKGRGVPVNRQTDRRGLEQRLDELTIAARGHAVPVTPQSTDIFDALLREIGSYYRLTVALDDRGTGRGSRRQDGVVRVETPGTRFTVRARPFLYDPAVAAEATTRADRVTEALALGGVGRDELPVRGFGALRVSGDRSISVLIAGEVDIDPAAAGPPSDQAGAGASDLAVSYALFDKDRQPIAAGELPPVAMAGPGHGRSFIGRLGGVAPGPYLLRIAAIDAAGRMGSVERELNLRATEAAGLVAGDVLLARVARGQSDALPSPDEIGAGASIVMQVDVAGDAGVRKALVGDFIVRPRGASAAMTNHRAQLVMDEAAGLARLVTTLDAGLLTPGDYEVVAMLTAPGGATLTTAARPLSVLAAIESGGESTSTHAPALPKTLLAPLTPAFARSQVLDPAVLAPVFARLESRAASPAVRVALTQARTAKPDTLTLDAGLRGQDPVAAAFLAGIAHFARGELEPAAARFREALRGDAEFVPAITYLGACYAAGGRDREAAGAWLTALITDTDDQLLHALVADAWLRAGDADAALEILEEATTRWPENRDLTASRVTALFTLGRTADALTTLDTFAAAGADQLFAAMRVLVEAHARAQAVVSPDADRTRLETYAARYATAGGSQQPLVTSWLSGWK
jgi:Tetratricopeptide repeat